MQQAEDEYFERLWREAEQRAALVEKPHHDTVNNPKHYTLFPKEGIEVRNVIEKLVQKFSPQESGMFISDYVQMMQYLMRFMDKNGVEDLKKARWYLDKMIEAYDSHA
jgi:predicted transcriptional regulator